MLNKVLTFLICTTFTFVQCYKVSYEQFLASTPKTFGLLTVTHARNNDNSYFTKYLKKYAEMDCPLMSQISIIWNNEEMSPEEGGITPNQQWRRPVYSVATDMNLMDFRYILPAESKAQVFFSIDDDVSISCEQLVEGFQKWQKYAVGDIGPIMSYGLRGFNFFSQTQTYKYDNPKNGKYYSLSLMGQSWVSRVFLDLYNIEEFQQIVLMRKIVRSKNNCDDIAFNFVVSHFFPQLLPVPLFGEITLEEPQISQSNTASHYAYRTQCIKQFTHILGYNPLRIVNSKVEKSSNLYSSIVVNQTLYMKKRLITELFNKVKQKGPTYSSDQSQPLQSSQIAQENNNDNEKDNDQEKDNDNDDDEAYSGEQGIDDQNDLVYDENAKYLDEKQKDKLNQGAAPPEQKIDKINNLILIHGVKIIGICATVMVVSLLLLCLLKKGWFGNMENSSETGITEPDEIHEAMP